MKIYRIEMMDRSNYHWYKVGGQNYKVQCFNIEAETAEEALTIAKNNNPNLIVNEDCIYTIEEYKAKEHEKKIRMAEVEVEQLKAELAKAEKYLENLKTGLDKSIQM